MDNPFHGDLSSGEDLSCSLAGRQNKATSRWHTVSRIFAQSHLERIPLAEFTLSRKRVEHVDRHISLSLCLSLSFLSLSISHIDPKYYM